MPDSGPRCEAYQDVEVLDRDPGRHTGESEYLSFPLEDGGRFCGARGVYEEYRHWSVQWRALSDSEPDSAEPDGNDCHGRGKAFRLSKSVIGRVSRAGVIRHRIDTIHDSDD